MKIGELKKFLLTAFSEKLKPLGFKKDGFGFKVIFNDFSYAIHFGSIDRDNSFPTSFSYSLAVKSLAIVMKHLDSFDAHFYTVIGGSQEALYEAKKYLVKNYDIYTENDARKMVEDHFKTKSIFFKT